MKLTTLSAAVAAVVVFASSAQAREHHHYHHPLHYRAVAAAPASERFGGVFHFQSAQNTSADNFGTRPAAWCGWQMRHLVSSDPGAEYNLARNWAHWGRSGPAGVGAVVVWAHHVGKIVG